MPRSKSGSSNGGIIGKKNNTSFGKDKVTTKTSTGCVSLGAGTTVINAVVVAGGGGGGPTGPGCNGGAGGGAGGARIIECIPVTGGSSVPVTVGACGGGS